MPGEKMARGRCQSCGMPIESGDFCGHCTDETGALLGFEETFERFVAFAMRQDASLDRQPPSRTSAALW